MSTEVPCTIRLSNVEKRYGSVLALEHVSIEATRGRILGILGRNGAGKSTLIGLMVGQHKADQGEVKVFDCSPPFTQSVRQRIGVAPQRLALYENLTVTENLILFGSLYGLSGAALKGRVGHVLDWLGLQPVASRRIKQCSGGMKRRTNLAAALLHDADLVLVDEPTAGVDVQSRETILKITREIAAAGKTVVYTTHYIEEADKICDDIVFLHEGRVIDQGDKDSLLDRHSAGSRIRYLDQDHVSQVAYSHSPGDFVRQQVEEGRILHDLSIVPPNLEDVFRSLTEDRVTHA